MTSQLRVVHRTGYTYDGGAVASYNEARMTPCTGPGQVVHRSRLEITPTPWMHTYTDYWGTQVAAFEIHEHHEQLSVVASTTVEVDRTPADGTGLTWAELRSPAVVDRHSEMLELAPSVEPGPELAEQVREMAASSPTPEHLARDVVAFVHDQMQYVPGSTGVHTRAAEAWLERSGVCQDMAQVTVGLLRTAGLPARYVSGYMMPTADAEIGVPQVGESHAWVQWWDGTWVGADPTNGVAPGAGHIEVARGRDYADVPPLRGIFTGVATSAMFVEVEVTRLG